MAFTVYGPGIKDEILLDNLFQNKEVEQAVPMPSPRRRDEEDQQQDNQGESAERRQADKAYRKIINLPREREPAIAAHQLMSSPVVTLNLNTNIATAWQLFRESRFRYVPIINNQHKLVGMLSDRALLRYAATTGQVPPYTTNSVPAQTSIESIIKMNVITATPDTRIREIARLLIEKRIGAMPIMDKYDNLVGIITRSDVLRAVVNNAPLELWV